MRLLGAGDNVVDKYVTLGKIFPGGNAVNVAVFAARLGADAAYMGVLGDDEAGRHVLKSLRSEGIQTEHTVIASGPNAYAEVRLVDTDRVFVGSNKGVALFDPTPEQFEAMAAFDVVHSAYSSTLEPHIATMAKHARVSYDFAGRFSRASAWPSLPNLYLATFSASNLDADAARQLAQDAVAAGAEHALVTRGAGGAYLASSEGVRFQEADKVVVRDTLGAGDAFIASVLVGLLSRRGVEQTLASASAHAAQVCMDYGAFGHGLAVRASSPLDESSRDNDVEQDKAGIS